MAELRRRQRQLHVRQRVRQQHAESDPGPADERQGLAGLIRVGHHRQRDRRRRVRGHDVPRRREHQRLLRLRHARVAGRAAALQPHPRRRARVQPVLRPRRRHGVPRVAQQHRRGERRRRRRHPRRRRRRGLRRRAPAAAQHHRAVRGGQLGSGVAGEALLRGGAARGARPAGAQHLVPGAVRGGPDGLTPAQCRRCLDDLMALWWNGSGFKPDGARARFAGSRCNLRSDLGEKFYTSSPMVKLQMNDGEVPAPAPSTAGKNNSAGRLLGIILAIVFVVVVTVIALCVCKKRRSSRGTKLPDGIEDFGSIKSTLLSLSSLQVATNNFDESNKLGEGGFGVVYKGDLSGQEVAVKRMSKGLGQGLEELKNELVLVAKLHHKNLVRLEGFCLEDGERLLVYEYLPNKSLDTILFDPEEKIQLDWSKRFNIIKGVARGLQYLHEESRKKIIHRDMKASNVLLDADMNPKIGDFGLARLFGQDQTRDVTKHIAGTFGYMSPEYVMRGQFSTKLDVFSFGVLVIEIVTGQRNTGQYFYDDQNEDIISLVWRHWTEGTIAEMIDDSLGRNYSETEVVKCVNIGLLCLQQSPMDRPTMSDVIVMLCGDDTSSLPPVARPTFFLDRSTGYSYNSCTTTQLSAR